MEAETAKTSAPAPAQDDNEDYQFGAPPKDLPKADPAPPSRVTDRGAVRIETIDLAKKRDRKRFLDVAVAIQSGDPNFIAPLYFERMKFLDTGHNPALAALEVKAMIATRDGRDVGRITAHVDRAYDDYHHVKVGWFGFFESVDDTAVAHALLDEAVKWAKQKGATQLIGPNNFTTNHQCGLLVENFDRPPFVEMTYNPAYYERLITTYGFGKAKDLLAWWIDVAKGLEDPKMKRYYDVSEKVKKRYGIRIRGARMADFENEVGRLFRVYNASWQKNWGFVPVSEAEFKQISADLKQVVVDSLVLLVEDKDGQNVAFAVSLPNVNEVMPKDGKLFPFGWWGLAFGMKKIKQARLMALGVVPGYRKRGVEALLCIETALRAKELGMSAGEIGWTLEDNVLINRAVESFGGHLDRRYRLLGLDLT